MCCPKDLKTSDTGFRMSYGSTEASPVQLRPLRRTMILRCGRPCLCRLWAHAGSQAALRSPVTSKMKLISGYAFSNIEALYLVTERNCYVSGLKGSNA